MKKLFTQKLIGAMLALAFVIVALYGQFLGYAAAKGFYLMAAYGVYLVFVNHEVLDI